MSVERRKEGAPMLISRRREDYPHLLANARSIVTIGWRGFRLSPASRLLNVPAQRCLHSSIAYTARQIALSGEGPNLRDRDLRRLAGVAPLQGQRQATSQRLLAFSDPLRIVE